MNLSFEQVVSSHLPPIIRHDLIAIMAQLDYQGRFHEHLGGSDLEGIAELVEYCDSLNSDLAAHVRPVPYFAIEYITARLSQYWDCPQPHVDREIDKAYLLVACLKCLANIHTPNPIGQWNADLIAVISICYDLNVTATTLKCAALLVNLRNAIHAINEGPLKGQIEPQARAYGSAAEMLVLLSLAGLTREYEANATSGLAIRMAFPCMGWIAPDSAAAKHLRIIFKDIAK